METMKPSDERSRKKAPDTEPG
jgi:hypothetical protein